MNPTLSDVKNLIDQLAQKINAPKDLLPTYGYPIDKGRGDIEIDNNGQIYYLPNERGMDRHFLRDVDDLLYFVFKNVTMAMASKYELSKRVAGQDSRRINFLERERLLGVLDEKWKSKTQKEHEEVLINYPFDDHGSDRVFYYQQLVKSGQHEGDEWLLACEKYPLLDKK
jgi:Immunity protein 63